MNKKNYLKIIDAIANDGYIVIENFFEDSFIKELLESAKSSEYKKAGISNSANLHTDNNRRRDKISWIDEKDSIQQHYIKFTNNLKDMLNKELYIGITYYESHFAIYENGDFYEKHLDAFKNSKNRVVTTVLYLNQDWETKDGGELLIYENEKIIKKVLPKANTLVVFLSDKFPHEVLKSNKKRYSIAGWFRVDR